ncbi:MAG: hypothetical protein ACYC8T_17640 [Myxococcaceae bacterium]
MIRTICAALAAAWALSVAGCTCGQQPPKDASLAPSSTAPGAIGKNPEGCNSDFAGLIQADYTLTQKCSPYTMARGLSVDGYVLTIEPGVEIRLGEGASLDVGYSRASRLVARGTREAPIRFVSAGRKEPGYWKSVALYDHSNGSVLDGVVIEHAGSGDKPALAVYSDNVHLSRLKVVATKAAAIEQRDFDRARIAELNECDFTEAGPAEVLLALNINSVGALAPDNRFPPTAVIKLAGRAERDVKVPNPGVPYRVPQDLDIEGTEGTPASLTLEPGTVFQMGEGAGINCGYSQNAAFRAVGTAEKPIVFARLPEVAKGSAWKGLQFFSNCRPPVLEHVKLAHGPRDGALVHHRGSKGLGSMRHCTLAQSEGHGLLIAGTKERFEAFDENTFEGLGKAAVSMPAEYAHLLGERNVFPAGSAVELEGDIRRDTTLNALSVPYVLKSGGKVETVEATRSATLTLLPGVTLKFGKDQRLSVGYGHPGALVAIGTEPRPILLSAAAESWRGLMLYEKSNATLEHVIIEKVSPDFPGTEARGSGTIKNVTFRDMAVGLRHCGSRLSATGLKVDRVSTAESKEGC